MITSAKFQLVIACLALLLFGSQAGAMEGSAGSHSGPEPDPGILHYLTCSADGSAEYVPHPNATAAYQWLDIVQEATARDVDKVGARPTIIARQMAIAMTAM